MSLVLCVWIPAFRLAVSARRPAGDDGRSVDLREPVILADKIERGRVVDATLTAAALGVRPGLTLVQAQAVAHDARTIVDDAAEDARVWADVLDALDAVSPIVEDDGLGRAFADLHGIGGTVVQLLAGARAALAGFNLPVRVAIGPNRFVAACAAWCGDGTVCDGDPAGFVAPLALDRLELDPNVAERLRLLGVTTLGELAALPHGPFVRRFGTEAATWHDRARGVDDRPLRPRPRALRIDRSLYGEGEASAEEQVLFALRTLVARVVDDLAAAGKRAGRLVLTLALEDGETHELATRVAQPTAVAATLFDLLRARLEGVTLGATVVGLQLVAEELQSSGVELSLFAAADPDSDALGVALARLEAAFGEGKALRARVVDGPRIERRFAFESFTLAPLMTRCHPEVRPIASPIDSAVMQLRLIEPRAIDVRVFDGAPRLVGTPPHTVVDYAGPWRVDEGWWAGATGDASRGERLVRDEYDVCLDDGSLLRIARSDREWCVLGIYD